MRTNAIDPIAVLESCCRPGSQAHAIILAHGLQVRDKALAVARSLKLPAARMAFIAQAALLHDIGIVKTATPELGCHGKLPYVCHGEMGARMLEARGLPQHARVCRTHVGVGLTAEEIKKRHLPLPPRDMLPQSLEEQIICYADKFFSKNGGRPREKSLQQVVSGLRRWGDDKVERFLSWHRAFSGQNSAGNA